MVTNNRLLETLFKCVKSNGSCTGCCYGESYDESAPSCMFHLMNDILFFFNNPVPDKNAHVIPIEELNDILTDKKPHLAFCEFISSIHVAKPSIRTITKSGNYITMTDPQTKEKDQFNISDYYTHFRIWSSKPTDTLRNETEWIPTEGYQYTPPDKSQIKKSKTEEILSYISRVT